MSFPRTATLKEYLHAVGLPDHFTINESLSRGGLFEQAAGRHGGRRSRQDWGVEEGKSSDVLRVPQTPGSGLPGGNAEKTTRPR